MATASALFPTHTITTARLGQMLGNIPIGTGPLFSAAIEVLRAWVSDPQVLTEIYNHSLIRAQHVPLRQAALNVAFAQDIVNKRAEMPADLKKDPSELLGEWRARLVALNPATKRQILKEITTYPQNATVEQKRLQLSGALATMPELQPLHLTGQLVQLEYERLGLESSTADRQYEGTLMKIGRLIAVTSIREDSTADDLLASLRNGAGSHTTAPEALLILLGAKNAYDTSGRDNYPMAYAKIVHAYAVQLSTNTHGQQPPSDELRSAEAQLTHASAEYGTSATDFISALEHFRS